MAHSILSSAILLCSIVFSAATNTVSEENNTDPILAISYGKIRGRSRLSQENNEYYAFQQIPYASPPIGQLRFKSPVPPEKWNNTLNATENTKICYQFDRNDPRENEDCLYLNVYTPVLDTSDDLLPVYVYIHGGKFLHGDGTYKSYGPEFLMDYGIILVTLNYRLGPFGFLSTGDSTVSGNMGLQDQLLALKWVRENIRAFGGDPHQVTLGGISAGASCVGHHILSPQSAGLFRSASMESGSPLCSKMLQKHPKYFAIQLATLSQGSVLTDNSSSHILQVLQMASVEDIKKNSDIEIPVELRNSVGNEDNKVWAPVIDGSFIIGPMHENLKQGRFSAVPTLMGINSEEELFYDLDELKPKSSYFDRNSAYLVNGNLNIKEENKLLAGQELKNLYTNESFEKNFGAFVKFVSDAKYTTAIARHADLQSEHSTIFFYQFSYHGLLNNNHNFVEGAERVGHSEELNYLFRRGQNDDLEKFPKSDLEVQSRLLEMWTNFVKQANPTPTDGFKWPRVEPGKFWYMNINATSSIEQNPRQYQKWRAIYEKYADQYQETY